MWLPEMSPLRPMIRFAAVATLAALTAGCFQPMLAERTTPAAPNIRVALSHVDIGLVDAPMGSPEARVGQVVRNALIFDTTGGAAAAAPTHRLKMRLVMQKSSLIVDLSTGRPEYETVGLDVTYSLMEVATNKVVIDATAYARVSYDVPGQQQRFARDRGLRAAEDRAARVLADQIKARLASYFVAGT